jgi:hypothetical protein
MKSILYVGATLMISASVYGFVDYKKTSRNKEFSNMYQEEKVPVVVNDNKITELVVKKEVAGNEKKAVTKKQVVSKDETIASIKPIAEDDKIGAKETKVIERSSVEVTASKDSGIENKAKKKKKLSTKLFSRGAMDDRYIEEKVEVPKEGVKKTENKEQ